MIDQDVVSASNYLKSKKINVPLSNEWLKCCVHCFKLQFPSFSKSELHNFVFEQWTLADLREVSAPSIPRDLIEKTKCVLPGSYGVQINYVLNVAVSRYKQLQKIRKPDSQSNLEVSAEPIERSNEKRALKLEVTDGVATVTAFEDQSIPHLPDTLIPGTKAVLTGPIECIKGVLMLKRQNIVILGGEVSTLHISNAVENVLARSLGVSENPDPYKTLPNVAGDIPNQTNFTLDDGDDEALLLAAEQMESVVTSPEVPPTRVSQTPAGSVSQNPPASYQTDIALELMDCDFDDDFELMAAETAKAAENKTKSGSKTIPVNVPRPTSQGTLDSFVSSQTRPGPSKADSSKNPSEKLGGSKKVTSKYAFHDSMALKKEMEKSFGKKSNLTKPVQNQISSFCNQSVHPVKAGSSSSRTSEREEGYFSDSGRMSVSSSNSEFEKHGPTGETPAKSRKIIVDYLEEDNAFLSNINTDEIEAQASQSPSRITAGPVLQSNPFPPTKFPSIVTVYAEVIKLSQKLSLRDDKWTLSAIVKAKGIDIEVDFSSISLDKIFGISAAEVTAKKKEVLLNPVLKEKINEILKRSQQKIKTLKCKMVFKFDNAISNPEILDIVDED